MDLCYNAALCSWSRFVGARVGVSVSALIMLSLGVIQTSELG